MTKKVGIIGAGESGIGAALLAKKMGMDVFVSDDYEIKGRFRKELIDNNIRFKEGGHKIDWFFDRHVVIKSPGVRSDAPLIQSLKARDITVIGEIEFGSQFFNNTLLAITGSNGKTTTSGLLYHVLRSAGLDVAIGGNYGKSFARILTENTPKYMVLEVSSFQLDDMISFKPDMAVLLNITPDHLDRYDYKIERYARSKMSITAFQDEKDLFIYNEDDALTMQYIHEVKSGVRKLAVRKENYIDGILSKDGTENFEISLKGRHNLFNAFCVTTICRKIGLTEEQIANGLKTFKNQAHRLETVGFIDQVEYINDSKATNVDAVYYALESMTKKVIWIAGGMDKGNDYEMLKPLVKEKVKTLICLGTDNSKLKEAFRDEIKQIKETTEILEAVQIAENVAEEGEVVLLSPACASFDLFKNYGDRGDQFKKAVWKLLA